MAGKKDAFFTLYGGAGKSSLAAEFSLTLDRQIITNQGVASPLPLIFDDETLLVLDDPNTPMPELPENADIIFDLGGYADHRVISALKQSNHVLIPVKVDTNRVSGLLSTIVEVVQYNPNIVIIVNPTKNEDADIETVQTALKKQKMGAYPVFPVRYSEAIPNIFNHGKSIHQASADNPLLRYSYRNVLKQIDAIIDFINGGKK